MLYCRKCMIMTDEKKCPMCNMKKLTVLNDNEPVYLITKEMIWSDTISSVLEEHNIPYLKHGNLGTALSITLGYGVEYYKFYVPYGEYQTALQLMKEIFPSDFDESYESDITE